MISNHTQLLGPWGQNGLRNPGNMIKKLVSDTIKKIAKKEGVAETKMKENLLNQGKKLLK